MTTNISYACFLKEMYLVLKPTWYLSIQSYQGNITYQHLLHVQTWQLIYPLTWRQSNHEQKSWGIPKTFLWGLGLAQHARGESWLDQTIKEDRIFQIFRKDWIFLFFFSRHLRETSWQPRIFLRSFIYYLVLPYIIIFIVCGSYVFNVMS